MDPRTFLDVANEYATGPDPALAFLLPSHS
jgi:hypothetical protein